MNVMQQPGPDLACRSVPGRRTQMARLFFCLHPYLAGRCCQRQTAQVIKVAPQAQAQVCRFEKNNSN